MENNQHNEKKENSNIVLDKVTEKALRPCCACPETRKLRDDCIREKSEELCLDLIEKHNECLRSLGFKV